MPAISVDRDLTVLLPLRDRVSYTLRWMRYAEVIRFPFHVLVADGGTDNQAAAAFADRSVFPHVSYEYVRYPYDATYADFYTKLHDAVSRVKTPLVALAGNDDFFVVGGLREAAAFLRDHQDYATCGGQSARFWVAGTDDARPGEGVYGRRVDWKVSLDAASLTAGTARERLRQQSISSTYLLLDNVHRTEILRNQLQVLRHLNPADFFLGIDYLLPFLSAIAGKSHQLDTLFLARQTDTPDSAGPTHLGMHGDWLGRMLIPSWSSDFANFVNATSSALALRDGLPLDEARRWIVDSYRMLVAPPLLEDVMKEGTVAVPMAVMVWFARRLLRLPPETPLRRAAQAVYRASRWISADAVHGTQSWGRRDAAAERAFLPIREFLTRGPLEGRSVSALI